MKIIMNTIKNAINVQYKIVKYVNLIQNAKNA